MTLKTKQTTEQKTYPQEGLARIPDAAEFLAVTRHTIYRMIDDGQIAYVEVRNVKRIPWQALHEFVAKS